MLRSSNMVKGIAALAFCGSLGLATVAQAITVEVATKGTADSGALRVDLTFTQSGSDVLLNAKVITDVNNPNTGDLRGLFFNVADNDLINALQVTGTGFTEIKYNTANLGNGALITPLGPYEIGIEIGGPGIGGGDDFQEVNFTLSKVGGLTLGDFSTNHLDYAVRATSVGIFGGSRDGSSKMIGTRFTEEPPCVVNCNPCQGVDCDPPGGGQDNPNGVPEPVTASLGLISAVGLFLATHRRRLS